MLTVAGMIERAKSGLRKFGAEKGERHRRCARHCPKTGNSSWHHVLKALEEGSVSAATREEVEEADVGDESEGDESEDLPIVLDDMAHHLVVEHFDDKSRDEGDDVEKSFEDEVHKGFDP